MPSGVFYQHTTSVIGSGVALNIPVLINEIKSITDRGVPAPKILVSDRAQIVMSYHILLDQYEEERLAGKSYGSTKSGIAPFYSDKYAKIGTQVSELFDDAVLEEKAEKICTLKNVLFEHLYHKEPLTKQQLMDEFWDVGSTSGPRTVDVFMTKLRAKLAGCKDFEIQTVHGLGYKAVVK